MPASPGVYASELDRSLYAPQASPTSVGMVCTATKGPLNERTLITDENQFFEVFGRPDVNSQGFYAARQFLREGNSLWVVRVGSDIGDDPLGQATATLVDAGDIDSVAFEMIEYGTFATTIKLVVSAGTTSGFKIQVIDTYGGEVELEVWDNLTRANVEDIVNDPDTGSEWITAEVLGVAGEPDPTQDEVFFEMTDLGGGVVEGNGFSGTNIASKVVAGILLFEDKDTVTIDTLMAPGFSDNAVVVQLITTAETRKDTVAIVDPPIGYTATEVVDWHNGGGGGTTLNSSYAALYWPEQVVYDEVNEQEVIVAPSGFAAAAFARTDRDTFSWYAPAGFPRGKVNSLRAEKIPTLGERDLMYGPGNNVNPIATLIGQGILIYGQKTLQRNPTALDRLNVRRMINQIKQIVVNASRPFLFDLNDAFTWRQWVGVIEPPLRDIQAQRGLQDFLVVMDETTNTESAQERSEMRGKIFLKPTKVAEQIILQFVITSQGADFQELLQAG